MKITEEFVSLTITIVLFLVCGTFVTHRGYECFKKYLNEPEAVDIYYKFTGEVPFPSLSICPKFYTKCSLQW